MSNSYVGEIRMFAGNFAPAGWSFCQGQVLPISEYDTLYQLIGTTYGGDGVDTFSLPDLQGRIPLHFGQGPGIQNSYTIGEAAGVETVTLTANQIPAHSHAALASRSGASRNTLAGGMWTGSTLNPYAPSDGTGRGNMHPSGIAPAGGSQPHENRMPFLAINFIISLFGIFPTQ